MGSTVEMAKLQVLPLLCVALAAVAFAVPQDLEDVPRSSDVTVDSDDEPREDELGLSDIDDDDDEDLNVIGELDRTDAKKDYGTEQVEPSNRFIKGRKRCKALHCRRKFRCRRWCKCGIIPRTSCGCK